MESHAWQVEQTFTPGHSSSLCLVKPHAVLSRKLGHIVSRLSIDFAISAMQTCNFDVSRAAQLLELYKRVLPPSEFSSMVEELSSGNLLQPLRPIAAKHASNCHTAISLLGF